MTAALNGYVASTRVLLVAGANFSIRNKYGKSALEFAQQMERTETISLLEEHIKFLAQLGSHTKPALRESERVDLSVPATDEEEDATKPVRNLLLEEQPGSHEDAATTEVSQIWFSLDPINSPSPFAAFVLLSRWQKRPLAWIGRRLVFLLCHATRNRHRHSL
eukprot:m.260139 g.260139  ORF g.260139 m.260139 type:complete len:163 (+) comp54594_c0_seq10:139-627(+)